MDASGSTPDDEAPHRQDELVVAHPHVDRVVEALREQGIEQAVPPENSELLGMALLRLRLGQSGPSVGITLRRVREYFQAAHAGWTPAIGRNRLMGHVSDAGQIQFGGNDDPRPVGREVEWTTRGSGPGTGVRVAVLDTALVPHPWQAGGWTARFSDVSPQRTANRKPVAGHAGFVTGLILRGAPGAVVRIRPVLGPDGTADAWSVANAIAQAGREDFDVVNLSLACWTVDNQAPLVLAGALARMNPRTMVVAAAGNHADRNGSARPTWPAALDGVVAVGATDQPDLGDRPVKRADFSPDEPWVDVMAPGANVVSTYLNGPVQVGDSTVEFSGFAEWSGTSFAAAFVSGAIAAGVDPGRFTARESWADVRSALGRNRTNSG